MLRVLVIALVAGLLASTEGAAAPAPANDTAHVTTAKKKKRRRPGCSRFCRQAGGFGAPPGETEKPVVIPHQTRMLGARGIVGIRARCTLKKTCEGAILLDGHVSYGRADLRIGAGKTRTVYVQVPAKGRAYLRRRHHDHSVYATVPLKGNQPVSFSRRLTLLPHG